MILIAVTNNIYEIGAAEVFQTYSAVSNLWFVKNRMYKMYQIPKQKDLLEKQFGSVRIYAVKVFSYNARQI